jgi:hypothetical protein
VAIPSLGSLREVRLAQVKGQKVLGRLPAAALPRHPAGESFMGKSDTDTKAPARAPIKAETQVRLSEILIFHGNVPGCHGVQPR